MTEDPAAFFVPVAGGFEPTELTRGPWDPDSQHAGPPAALIGRAIERCEAAAEPDPPAPAAEWIVGRVTYEILRPIPIARLEVEARVRRPGRRVQLLDAELRDANGPLVLARGWRIRGDRLELPAGLASEGPESPARLAGRPTGELGPPAGPDRGGRSDFFPTEQEVGYHTAMEYRFVRGSFVEAGPATSWMRMRHPLIAGERPSPLQRVLVAADSGNGISSTLDFHHYLFINVDLSVHLHRMPVGEWVCLDALTVPEPTGVGLADAALYDERGPIGRAAQTLLVAERRRRAGG
jgi:hypothetical protein